MEEPRPLTTFHTENEERSLSKKAAPTLIKRESHNGGVAVLGQNEEAAGEEAACSRSAVTSSLVLTVTLLSKQRCMKV